MGEGDKSGWDGVVTVELTRDEAKNDVDEVTDQAFRSRVNSASSGFYSPIGIHTPPVQNLNVQLLQAALNPFLMPHQTSSPVVSPSSLGSSPVPEFNNMNFPSL